MNKKTELNEKVEINKNIFNIKEHKTEKELIDMLKKSTEQSKQNYIEQLKRKMDEITGYRNGIRNLKKSHEGYTTKEELVFDELLQIEVMRYGNMDFEVIFDKRDRIIPSLIHAYHCPKCDIWITGDPKQMIYKKGTTAEQIANDNYSDHFIPGESSLEKRMSYQCRHCGYTKTDGKFMYPLDIKNEEFMKDL